MASVPITITQFPKILRYFYESFGTLFTVLITPQNYSQWNSDKNKTI